MLGALGLCLVTAPDAANIFCPAAAAQEVAVPEYKVKAAFLYNFAKLTEWPTNTFPDAAAPLTIGVLGKDPFGTALKKITRDKKILGRPVTVVNFQRLDQVKDCQLLFIAASEKSRLPAILTRLAGQPILTVGDTDRFAHQGGIIGLNRQGVEIRFEINREAAAQGGLTLSSKLLRLAEIVVPDREGKRK
jgi:hypothetical protein